MDDDVHVAQFVEEALDHESSRARQRAERGARGLQVLHRLAGGLGRPAGDSTQPGSRIRAFGEPSLRAVEEVGYPSREFPAASGRLTEPERDGGRRSPGVLHIHLAGGDALDAVGGIAQLEDVAGQALEGKILVQCADAGFRRHQQHVVIELVRYGSAVGEGSDARGAARPQELPDAVQMKVSAGAPTPCGVTVRQHLRHLAKPLAIQLSVRPGQRVGLMQFVDAFLAAGPFRHDLLRQHIHCAVRNADLLDFVHGRGLQQREALHQFAPGQREKPTPGNFANGVARTPDALQKTRDAARRAQLTDQVHRPDVDAQFQRGRRDKDLEASALETLLGIAAVLLGHAAVVGRDSVLAQSCA